MGQIKIDQIVAQQKVRATGKIVQFGQCRIQAATAVIGIDQGPTGVRAHRSELVDAVVPAAHFKIQ